MRADELLSYLRSLDVKLWVEGDQLAYRAPEGVLSLALRDLLLQRKVELLSLLRQLGDSRPGSLQRLCVDCREERIPLSYGQQRLWFLDQLLPANPAYNLPMALRFRGQLAVEALERAINEIVRRHEVLRTTFKAIDGNPVPVIAEALTVQLRHVDLSSLPETDRQREATQLARKEARIPFDLAQGPLMRVVLLTLNPRDHLLVAVLHHIACDGWSLRVFSRELAALYDALSRGLPSPLPPLSLQYADFAIWQRQCLKPEVLAKHLDYWRSQLADLRVLQLPPRASRGPVQSFRGDREILTVPAAVAAALKDLSRKQGVTLFMMLLAAFQTLLHRYTGQTDIAVGSPAANRDRSEIEPLIGFFVNSLVLRTDFSGDPSFRELLVRVRDMALAAYAHQELPFEKLVEELQPHRDLSLNPLFQVMFQLLSPAGSKNGEQQDPFALFVETGTSKFDLELDFVETEEELRGYFEYSADLFDAATISRLARHFKRLLESVVSNPEQRVSELPLLTSEEERQIMVAWNATGSDYPRDCCIHELFEAQAERTPQAVAAVFEGSQLTYDELNRRANQLARELLFRGIGPGVPIAVCMKPSLQMLVALLGVLKAGGFYVPIDPSYPRERLSFMLKDAQAEFLIYQNHQPVQLDECPLPRVDLDENWSVIEEQAEENLGCRVTPEHLAYVMYTSGSTGRPKGVAVPHRAVNRLISGANYVDWEPGDCVAQVSNLCFDAATFEIWGALLTGAQLVGIPGDVALCPREFSARLRQQQISVLFLTTDLLNELVTELPDIFRTIRLLFFGGSAVDPRPVRQILKHGPPQRLVHVYGPTENTTFSSWHLVREVPEDVKAIPIGRPISNTQIYLLDLHGKPVPVGVPGEIYLGGDGLANGYYSRPELTAEQFVPDGLGNTPGARLYRTGDLGCYLPDGSIEFLGRLDDQVKIRGFRIEPAEVEAALRMNSSVRDCRVMARSDCSGQQRLVAYVVPRQQPGPSSNQLRSFLKAKLPGHMVPSAYVWLAALPIGPGGKVNPEALPLPDSTRPKLEVQFVEPRTAVEERLAAIWMEVLGLEQVGVEDDFFELGGHSLLATQVLSRVRESFQWEVPLRALFERPTVAGLAEWVETQHQKEKRTSRIRTAESLSPSSWPGVAVNVDLLSDEEVDSMLKGYLAKGMAE